MTNIIRKIVFIISICLFICENSEAQPNSFQKRYGTSLTEYALQMIPCDNGDFFALAWRNGQKQILIFRLDYTGNIIWERVLEDTSTLKLKPVRCIETLDHGFCIFATPQYSTMTSAYPSSSALIKLNSQGQLQWTTRLTVGGNIFDGSDIAESPNGSIYISGDLIQWPDPNSPPHPYIIKFNSTGQLLWSRHSLLVSGYTNSKLIINSDTTLFLAINGFTIFKLDSAGNTINSTVYRDSAGTTFSLEDCLIDSAGYFAVLLTNNTSQSVTLCKLNSQGNPISAVRADKSGYTLKGIQLLAADTGYVALIESNGSSKIIVTDWSDGTTTPNGIRVGINNPFLPVSFARKPDGSLFIYGSLNAVADLHLVKTDITTIGILPLTGCSTDTTLLSISPISITDSILSFVFIPFSLIPYPSYLTDSSVVLNQSTDCMLTGIDVQSEAAEFSIFPNPASDFAMIQSQSLNEKNLRIKVLDILGQTVIEETENAASGNFEKKIELSSLNNGIYFIVVCAGEKEFVQKLVIQR